MQVRINNTGKARPKILCDGCGKQVFTGPDASNLLAASGAMAVVKWSSKGVLIACSRKCDILTPGGSGGGNVDVWPWMDLETFLDKLVKGARCKQR